MRARASKRRVSGPYDSIAVSGRRREALIPSLPSFARKRTGLNLNSRFPGRGIKTGVQARHFRAADRTPTSGPLGILSEPTADSLPRFRSGFDIVERATVSALNRATEASRRRRNERPLQKLSA